MATVQLYVYDISQGLARQFGRAVLGIDLEGVWHTGIVVYGNEYFYGGGLTYDVPGRTPFGTPVKTVTLGETAIPMDIFHEFLNQISTRFTEYTYNILTHNCNNFTDAASQFLLGSGIPHDIISLPERVLATPMGKALLQPMFDQMQAQMTSYHGAHQIGTNMPGPGAQTAGQNWQTPFQNTVASQPYAPSASIPAPRFNVQSPTHPHEGLKFKAITYWKPSLFSNGKVSLVLPKLKTLFTESSGEFTHEDATTFSIIERILTNPGKVADFSVPSDVFPLISKMISVLPNDKVFPCLDLVRMLMLHPTVVEFYARERTFLHKAIALTVAADTPLATRLMASRLLANVFSYPAGGAFLSSREIFSQLVHGIMAKVDESDKMFASIQAARITLVYNLSLYVPKDGSDDLAQVILWIHNQLETEKDHENGYSLLLALGHFLYCNSDGVDVMQALELSLDRWKQEANTVPKLHPIVEDITLLLQ